MATWILFGKLFGVATLVGFGEKRCRKNLPLSASNMDIDSAISHLESLGLYVDRHVPGAMSDAASNEGLTIARALVPQGGLHHLEDACFVFPLRGAWCYRNWNGIGGRAPDDVHIENLALDIAITHPESFYFGSPLILDDWIFPTHCHPEWDAATLRTSFDAASHISHAEWRRIRSDRHIASKTLDETSRFLAKFREIPAVPNCHDALRLWMRNDVGEMFVVRSA